jgi:hypothetical protein
VDFIDWRQRRITDSAQNILKQISSRAAERGLHVVDDASIVILALESFNGRVPDAISQFANDERSSRSPAIPQRIPL